MMVRVRIRVRFGVRFRVWVRVRPFSRSREVRFWTRPLAAHPSSTSVRLCHKQYAVKNKYS